MINTEQRNTTSMGSTSLDVVAATGQTEMEAEKRTNRVGIEVEILDNFLAQYGDDQVRNIANAGLQDSDSQTLIIDLSNLLASVYDNLKSGFNEGELEEYTERVSRLSSTYKNNTKLVKQMAKWREYRKKLIDITKSSAETLDQNFVIVNIARMVGSLVEILYMLNLGIYQKFCSSIACYAYNISPRLGLITESVLELAPHLRFMGFASSFFEILRSQIVVNSVVKAMKEDKDKFEPLKEWVDETNELEESVKKLFPYGINKEIAKNIDKALEDLGKEEKIFSAAVLSNVMKDPAISKDGKFLAKVFLFCRSDASKEWYNRMVMGEPPSDLERCMFYFRSELQQLEGTDVDSGSKIEIAICTAEQLDNSIKNNAKSILSRIILCGMSGMSVYYCYENIRSGSKHRHSSRLRELSANAQLFLNKMGRIGI